MIKGQRIGRKQYVVLWLGSRLIEQVLWGTLALGARCVLTASPRGWVGSGVGRSSETISNLIRNDNCYSFCASQASQQGAELDQLGASLGHGSGTLLYAGLFKLGAVVGSNRVQDDETHIVLLDGDR